MYIYDKQGVKVFCEQQQVETLLKVGYSLEVPKNVKVSKEEPKVEQKVEIKKPGRPKKDIIL